MKTVLLLGAALLLVPAGAVSASPASAAVAPPVKVLSGICSDGLLDAGTVDAAKGPDGKAHGFANFTNSSCGDKITYFEGSGTSWTSTPTPWVGKVVSVSADAQGSYLLYIIREIGVSELAVGRRTLDGRFYRDAVIASIDDQAPQDGRGSLVANKGLWYAVWPHYNATTGTYVLYQAESLFGGGADPGEFYVGTPTTPKSTDTHPELTLGPDGQARLFWQRAVAGGKQDLLLAAGAYGAWNDARRVASAVAISALHPKLDVVATDKRTFTSWTKTANSVESAVVASNSGGTTWTTSTPPTEYATSWDAHIQASSTTVVAGFGTGDEYPGEVVTGLKNGSSPWSIAGPSGVPGSIDTHGVAAVIYKGSGKYTALVYSGSQLFAVNR